MQSGIQEAVDDACVKSLICGATDSIRDWPGGKCFIVRSFD
jgi:hypothetical protein